MARLASALRNWISRMHIDLEAGILSETHQSCRESSQYFRVQVPDLTDDYAAKRTQWGFACVMLWTWLIWKTWSRNSPVKQNSWHEASPASSNVHCVIRNDSGESYSCCRFKMMQEILLSCLGVIDTYGIMVLSILVIRREKPSTSGSSKVRIRKLSFGDILETVILLYSDRVIIPNAINLVISPLPWRGICALVKAFQNIHILRRF